TRLTRPIFGGLIRYAPRAYKRRPQGGRTHSSQRSKSRLWGCNVKASPIRSPGRASVCTSEYALGISCAAVTSMRLNSSGVKMSVVSLSYLDRSVQAEEIGVPIGRVDQQTVPERDTTATRRSSTHGRSNQLPWPVCVAAG